MDAVLRLAHLANTLNSYSLMLFLLLLCALIHPSRQDVMSCGTTSYQVSFEPNRPIFTAFINAGHGVGTVNPTAGGNGGTSGQQQSGGPFTTAKFIYKPIDQFLPPGGQVCNLGPTLSQLPPQPLSTLDHAPRLGTGGGRIPIGSFDGRLVVSKCDNCSNCPIELPFIHRFLSRRAAELNLLSLLVIVTQKDNQFEHIRLAENSITKFVFMEEDIQPQQLALCELAESSDSDALRSFSKTSVLFVSISFIILMVISLAWLVFYYVQRFRYAHAKDRLQRRLFNAAKKALTRIPTRPVRAGDKELDSDCPVCIDPYRQGDIVRMLPCRHLFHKSCVDPWLLEHRTCPMCKSDILKAFGYHIGVSSRRRAQFSSSMGMDEEAGGGGGGRSAPQRSHDGDHLSFDANSSTGSESNFPFPVVSEVHDPFGFSISSPQLVQVMHAANARGFSIIPLTVHSSSSEQPCSSSSPSNHHPQETGLERGDGHVLEPAIASRPIEPREHQIQHSPPPPAPTPGRPATAAGVGKNRVSGAMNADSQRLFHTVSRGGTVSTHSGRWRRRNEASSACHGHVVNLVHLRSRSLSQSQIQSPTTASAEAEANEAQSGEVEKPTAVLRTYSPRTSPHYPCPLIEVPPGAVLSFPPINREELRRSSEETSKGPRCAVPSPPPLGGFKREGNVSVQRRSSDVEGTRMALRMTTSTSSLPLAGDNNGIILPDVEATTTIQIGNQG